jgi:hypothetical protein
MIIDTVPFQVFLTLFLVSLGPFFAWIVKIYNFDLKRSLRYFIFLTVLRLTLVGAIAFYLSSLDGNVVRFLLVFGTVYSLGLFPEVLLIARILKEDQN